MKKILVTRSSMPLLSEYIQEISTLWESHWLTNMGVKHQKLQKDLESYLKADHVELLVNGHMSLELTMQAMKLQGEVITTPFTFASTTHAIVRNGLIPVFCDINSNNFTIDTDKIERLITSNTCAIMPVHVYGNVCNMEEIDRIAQNYGLKVIYDAAHAFGIEYKRQGIGKFGNASCFSFHATKVFNTIEGGAVCYHDEDFGRELYRLKDFGIRDEETVDGIGANAKMNEFCAAMGLCNLRNIDREIGKRKLVVERYRERLTGVRGITLNNIQKDVKPNYAYFPVVFDEKEFGVGRDGVYEKLCKNNIYARKYFYPITNSFECFRGQYRSEDTPIALYISQRVLTLPLYADLALEDVDRICDIVLSCRCS